MLLPLPGLLWLTMITSAAQFGEVLAERLFSLATEDLAKNQALAEEYGADASRFIREKILLEIWIRELAVSLAVGMTSAHRGAILDAFFSRVEAIGWPSVLSDASIRAAS